MLCATVGLGQGHFRVVTDKLGQRMALNASSNRHLFRGLSARATERLGSALPPPSERIVVGADALLDMAAALLSSTP